MLSRSPAILAALVAGAERAEGVLNPGSERRRPPGFIEQPVDPHIGQPVELDRSCRDRPACDQGRQIARLAADVDETRSPPPDSSWIPGVSPDPTGVARCSG